MAVSKTCTPVPHHSFNVLGDAGGLQVVAGGVVVKMSVADEGKEVGRHRGVKLSTLRVICTNKQLNESDIRANDFDNVYIHF